MTQPKGIIIRSCKLPIDEVIDHLVILLQQNGATVYARINQQTELHNAGFEIPPLQFILFGNPHAGGSLMTENPVAALDLPLKIIAWQDNSHKNWVAYNDPQYIERRYGFEPDTHPFLNLEKIVSVVLRS